MLGFAFKADTGDTRESAAITLIKDFQAEKALINIYDPQVERSQIWLDLQEASPDKPLGDSASTFLPAFWRLTHLFFFYLVQRQVTICSSALDACKNAEAVVIATEWKEFKEIDWEKVYEGMNKPAFIFDGRLLLNADELRKIGFRVKTIGRGEKFWEILSNIR